MGNETRLGRFLEDVGGSLISTGAGHTEGLQSVNHFLGRLETIIRGTGQHFGDDVVQGLGDVGANGANALGFVIGTG